MSDRRTLISTGGSLLALQAAGMALAFALSVTLARGLGAAEYGLYAYALSIATLLAVPVQLGLPTLVVRETAKLDGAGDHGRMLGLWRWATLGVLGVSVLLVPLVFGLAPVVLSEALTRPLLAIVLLLVPVMAVGGLRAAALRGLGHVVQGQLPEVLLRPGVTLVAVLGAMALGHRLGAVSALALNLAAAALAFVVGAVLLLRVAPRAGASDGGRLPHRDWLTAGLFLGVASSALVVNRNLDMVMLGGMRPAAEAGTYKVAVTLATLSATALGVLNLALQPRIARQHAAGDRAAMRAGVTWVARASFGAGLAVALVFLLFGRALIGLAFGADYVAAYPAMAILIAGQLANTFFGPVMLVLNMTGHERLATGGVLASVALNAVLNAVLIPRYGIVGAAVATSVTLLAWNLALEIATLRRLGIDCSALGRHRREDPA